MGIAVRGGRTVLARLLMRRAVLTLGVVTLLFGAVAVRLVHLGATARPALRLSLAEPIGGSFARPDIVDRRGRLLASDVETHSLYADPALVLDADEVVEKLAAVLPDLNEAEVRRGLGEPSRRFLWIRRGLTPRLAQQIHALGLPGIGFRKEPFRVYPAGSLAGHVLGAVNVDNKGVAGIERWIDETGRVDAVVAPGKSLRAPVRLTLDIGAQHVLADELAAAMTRYRAVAAAGLVMDAVSGEVVAAAALPEPNPSRATDLLDPARIDRLSGSTFELGSIFKAMTVAMALDSGKARLDTMLDVRAPLEIGSYTIKDLHPAGRPLTVRDIFIQSSNVGAGMLALQAGADAQRAFLARFGMLESGKTELGATAAPQIPKTWGKIETVTIAYGHGLAVAPLQFAAAFATLVNGGLKVTPRFVAGGGDSAAGERLLKPETSAQINEVLRLNVTAADGTGRRAEAEAAGYRLGGKTGTAEMPGADGYQKKDVIASFVGAFPMDQPRYVTFVMLMEPEGTAETKNAITAGVNAAPVTGRLVARIAPILGVMPRAASVP